MDFELELMVLPVSDVDRARDFYVERAGFHPEVDTGVDGVGRLVGRGVEVGGIRHMESGTWRPGPHPERQDYNSFAGFTDPDGNLWLLQERRGKPGQ